MVAQLDMLAFGERLKEQGLERVEAHHGDFLETMRDYAKVFSQRYGYVSSDELRRYAKAHGIEPDHPNAWGAVFQGKNWRHIGRKKSTLPSNHAREIRVWRWIAG